MTAGPRTPGGALLTAHGCSRPGTVTHRSPIATTALSGGGVLQGTGVGGWGTEPRAEWRLGRGETPGDSLLPSPPPGCAPGVWGLQCDKPCHCGNGSSCDPKSGACSCPPGLQPPRCLEPCSPGHYGPACQFHCLCHGAPCDPQTGACFCPPERTGARCIMGSQPQGPTSIHRDPRGLRLPNGTGCRGQGPRPSSAAC